MLPTSRTDLQPDAERRRAVFFDRDGTVIIDRHYPKEPAEVDLFPGAAAGLIALRAKGFLIFVVSNQSGVGRKMITEEDVGRVHDAMVDRLRIEGAGIDGVRYCLHAPWDGCDCRKPSPRFVLELASEHDVDLARSFMVGDKPDDVETGKRAGTHTILFAPEAPDDLGTADAMATNWNEIIQLVDREMGSR